MSSAFEFCFPIVGTKVPAGPEWPREIKYDGYRLLVKISGVGDAAASKRARIRQLIHRVRTHKNPEASTGDDIAGRLL